MEFAFIWLVLCVVAGVIANKKGRSGVGFFLLSVFLSPLIGIIWALIASRNEAALTERDIAGGSKKKCPRCAELVLTEAKACKHCGHEF